MAAFTALSACSGWSRTQYTVPFIDSRKFPFGAYNGTVDRTRGSTSLSIMAPELVSSVK
ncbi:hypothetical protein ACPCSF_24630 [Streptomyces griseoincarnatus]